MPQPLAGLRVEREQAVGEEVLADPIRAVEVVVRRAGRHVDDAALFVDRKRAPVVGAADVLVRLLRPGVVAELAGQRNRVELPDLVPGDDVVGADVAGRRDERFAGRRSQDDEVLPDLSGAVGLDASRLLRSRETDAQIDRAVFAERQDRLAGRGVNRLQVAVDREQQPLVLAVGALPVVDAARDDAAEPLVDPQLIAGRGIERDQRVVPPEQIHHVVDDDRVEPR